VYCGPREGENGPLPLGAGRNRDPRWRQVLWQWRRRVTAPPGSAATQWKQYQEAARHDGHR